MLNEIIQVESLSNRIHVPISSTKEFCLSITTEVALVDPTHLHLSFNNVCPVSDILVQKRLVGIHCKKFGES